MYIILYRSYSRYRSSLCSKTIIITHDYYNMSCLHYVVHTQNLSFVSRNCCYWDGFTIKINNILTKSVRSCSLQQSQADDYNYIQLHNMVGIYFI